jgi:hypothetical protein
MLRDVVLRNGPADACLSSFAASARVDLWHSISYEEMARHHERSSRGPLGSCKPDVQGLQSDLEGLKGDVGFATLDFSDVRSLQARAIRQDWLIH